MASDMSSLELDVHDLYKIYRRRFRECNGQESVLPSVSEIPVDESQNSAQVNGQVYRKKWRPGKFNDWKSISKTKRINHIRSIYELASINQDFTSIETYSGPLNTAAQIFLFSHVKNKEEEEVKQTSFSIDEKVIALSLLKSMGGTYKYLSEYFSIPTVPELRKLLNRVLPSIPGINKSLENCIKPVTSKMCSRYTFCILIFQEIKIKPYVSYDDLQDVIWGFQNTGEVRRATYCDSAYVFMLRGICLDWIQPVAFIFTGSHTKSYDLWTTILSILESAKSMNLTVVATMSNYDKTVVDAFNVLKRENPTAYCLEGLEAFSFDDRQIIHLYSLSDILKLFTNDLLTDDLYYSAGGLDYTASWIDIEQFYKYDCSTFKRCETLTEECVVPSKLRKQSGKKCTNVFKESVSTAMLNVLREVRFEKHGLQPSALGTARMILFISKLYDTLGGIREGNSLTKPELNIPLTNDSGHFSFWREAKEILNTMRFSTNDEKECISISNWLNIIKSYEYLWDTLQCHLYSLNLRNFNTDPLDKLCCEISRYPKKIYNPTSATLVSSFKSLCLNNFKFAHSPQTNYEESFQQLVNFKYVRKEPVTPIETYISSNPQYFSKNSKGRCTLKSAEYGANLIAHKILFLIRMSKCKRCIMFLLKGNELKPKHLNTKILMHPKLQFMEMFKIILNTTFSFLPEHCHEKAIKKKLVSYIRAHMLSNLWFECAKHDLETVIIELSVKYAIFKWCKNMNNS